MAQFSTGETFWLTTLDGAGAPHTFPLFAVHSADATFQASSATASKTPALRAGRATSIVTTTMGIDVVWTGTTTRVIDPVGAHRGRRRVSHEERLGRRGGPSTVVTLDGPRSRSLNREETGQEK